MITLNILNHVINTEEITAEELHQLYILATGDNVLSFEKVKKVYNEEVNAGALLVDTLRFIIDHAEDLE